MKIRISWYGFYGKQGAADIERRVWRGKIQYSMRRKAGQRSPLEREYAKKGGTADRKVARAQEIVRRGLLNCNDAFRDSIPRDPPHPARSDTGATPLSLTQLFTNYDSIVHDRRGRITNIMMTDGCRIRDCVPSAASV
jgi:hypothetical protein